MRSTARNARRIDPARQARANRAHAVISHARAHVATVIVTHIVAHPDQTMSQVLYLTRANDEMLSALGELRTLPVEHRPGLVLSQTARTDATRRVFALLVEGGDLVRTGWRGGSATYRAACL